MGDHPLIPGGHNYIDLRTQDVKINVADAAQAVPDAVRNAPVPTQTNVVSTQLAPGVYLVAGGSHNSVAVEFKDYVTVIEGPLSNQRTNAVVAEVHKLFPNKPIRYLVNTHNHFDHLGGVRGFVAEGATVITAPGRMSELGQLRTHAAQQRGIKNATARFLAGSKIPAIKKRGNCSKIFRGGRFSATLGKPSFHTPWATSRHFSREQDSPGSKTTARLWGVTGWEVLRHRHIFKKTVKGG
jgi:glyoxylase-like metal-dependent hydrolase (beta-lactamase superfamily II)